MCVCECLFACVVPVGEARFFSTRALISESLLLFLFTALGSSFSSPAPPAALSFFRALSLAADRLRALVAAAVAGGGGGGVAPFSKKTMSSPLAKPRPSVGVCGVSGLWPDLGTSGAAFGDETNPGREFCMTRFWISSARCRRLWRNSCCFRFCSLRSSEADIVWTGEPAGALLGAEGQKSREKIYCPMNTGCCFKFR